MWVYLYPVRKQLYDNTNNGIEAKNKVFKYSFLKCCRSLLLSQRVHLIVDIFIPMQTSRRSASICQLSQAPIGIDRKTLMAYSFFRYTWDNARVNPSVVQSTVSALPHYLTSRPQWFIWNCIKKIDLAE